MEMAFLVLLYSTGAVIIPEKYEISQCEYIAKDHFGAKCIPVPKGDYCKWYDYIKYDSDNKIVFSGRVCY